MARSKPGGSTKNSPNIAIINSPASPPSAPPPAPEPRGGPGPWAVFVASMVLLALAVIVALVSVAVTGDPARAQALGAFIAVLLAP